MDINYLLWLQDLRAGLPGGLTTVLRLLSDLAASSALIVIPCVLYWCLDKRAGQFLVFSFSFSTLFNNLAKSIACAARPWVRSTDIHPVEAALEKATGYSFPSGHVSASAALIGGTGWYYRKRWRVLCIACWLYVLLVGFTRNYLGVHTPQDVLVGLLVGVASIALASLLLRWVDGADKRDLVVLVACAVVGVAAAAFVVLKPYPADQSAAGELSDAVEMQVDFLKADGAFLGAALGWFLERRFVGFQTEEHLLLRRYALRFVVGMLCVAVLHLAPRLLLLVGTDVRVYEFVKYFMTIVGAAYVAPAAFSAVERWVDAVPAE